MITPWLQAFGENVIPAFWKAPIGSYGQDKTLVMIQVSFRLGYSKRSPDVVSLGTELNLMSAGEFGGCLLSPAD